MAEDPPPALRIERTGDASPCPSDNVDPLRSPRLARGFTITITNSPSEAPRQVFGSEVDHCHLSVDSPMGSDVGFPPLDRTESRLPSLAEMLADEQLRDSVLATETEEHKAFQKAILEKTEHAQFNSLLLLVKDAYESEDFRANAANDAQLTDTIVLFVKQRCHNLYETVIESEENDSQIRKSTIVSMALLVAVLKFTRNIVAASESMALYLHDHRLADLLLMNLNVFLTIDSFVDQISQGYDNDDDDDPVPSPNGIKQVDSFGDIAWAVESLEKNSAGRALVQLLANLVSRAPKQLCPHLLPKVFPTTICSLCALTQDADLVCCLLHQLVRSVSPSKLSEYLISDSRASQAWYGLLSQCWHQFYTFKRTEKENEWISLLCAFFLEQKQNQFIGHILQALEVVDPTVFYGSLTQPSSPPCSPKQAGKPVLRRAASSTLQSSSYTLPPSIAEAKSEALFVRDPRAVIDLLLQVVTTLIETAENNEEKPGAIANVLESPILWDLIITKFTVVVDFIKETTTAETSSIETNMHSPTGRRRSSVVQRHKLQRDGGSFKEYQRLCAAIYSFVSSQQQETGDFYNTHHCRQLLQLSVECLEALLELHEKRGSVCLNNALEIVDRKLLIRIITNICHGNSENSNSIAEQAAHVLNKCGGRFSEEPGLEETAAFCVKTLSQYSDQFKQSFAKARQQK